MKVTIFQTDIRWASPDENVRNVQRLMDENGGSDLYVLPEMWATGFATTPHDIAENTEVVEQSSTVNADSYLISNATAVIRAGDATTYAIITTINFFNI